MALTSGWARSSVSVTLLPSSRVKLPVCWKITLMPLAFFCLISSRKPAVRSSVTLTPGAPSRIARLGVPPGPFDHPIAAPRALLDEVGPELRPDVLAALHAGDVPVDRDHRDVLG